MFKQVGQPWHQILYIICILIFLYSIILILNYSYILLFLYIMFKQVAQPGHQLQPAELSRQQPPGFCSALHWSGFTSPSIFAWEVFFQVNLERTYLSGDQLERLIREMSSIQSSNLVKGLWRLKKLNLSFNNMSSLPPAMLARFVRNLEQVISYRKVVMALHGLLPI